MKYMVTFSCGHRAEVELFGPTAERERKIAYYEKHGTCPQCYAEMKEIEKSIGCDEVEMPYKRYKTEFADCKTKAGSWNPDNKTIIVYVPAKWQEKEENE